MFQLLKVYLADDGELPHVDVEAIDAQRKDSSQSHHAAHCGHVVKVRLRVLNVPEAKAEKHTFTVCYYKQTQQTR